MSASSPPAHAYSPVYSPAAGGAYSPAPSPAGALSPSIPTASSSKSKSLGTKRPRGRPKKDKGSAALSPAPHRESSEGPADAAEAGGSVKVDGQGQGLGQEEEEDEPEDWMEDDEFERERAEVKQAKEDLSVLLENFSEDQLLRYETYRRSALNKGGVKKLCNQVLSQSVSQNVAIVVAGFSKVFVGEIVEKARAVQKSWNHTGPLAPEHLREAYRLYVKERGGSLAGGRKGGGFVR